ncbi:type II toxin-antitoxin system RelE/ParE family toxin [Patescibacteria group bacterium]|nr:type II toxin-antitoxin system RelE/ParE family toxin [Patescibacteria group bacterium]MBU4141972.1 type II toxin-antitoxin system RelE/ParE family toxin [Patescibacteria group bacterium]MBU4579962.1 type II toxin-antitoxin system RelE/ParE family toxin [Patescibacteria group bacterium]
MFDVFITSSAKKSAKRLPEEVKKEVVKLCETHISLHPFDADKLQSPLDECRSLHFKLNNTHYRIAYRIVEDKKRIDIVLIGTRENFYNKLKRALK